MTRLELILAVVLLVACPVLVARARCEDEKAPSCLARGGERIDRMVTGLTLSAEQKAKLDQVKGKFDAKLNWILDALARLDEQLGQEVMSVLTPEQSKFLANKVFTVTGHIMVDGKPAQDAEISFQPSGKGDPATFRVDKKTGRFAGQLKAGQYYLAIRGKHVHPRYHSPKTSAIVTRVAFTTLDLRIDLPSD